jgi:uncharacterized protein
MALTTSNEAATTIRIVPLYGTSAVAAVHPSSGAWVLIDESASAGLPVSGDGRHAELAPDHKFYGDVVAATREYRAAAAQRPAEVLDTVILKVTNRCNEACLHCYDACGHAEKDADGEAMMRVVDEALALSGPTLNLLFHGGEPFLRIDIMDRVAGHARARAAGLGKTVGLFAQTNASILNDRIIGVLQKHDFGLGISLDGWAELHDEMRVMSDGAGTYRLFERTYRKHRDFLIRNSGIMTTVMSNNVHLLSQVVLHIRDLGFRTWDATLFDLNGRGALYPHLAVDGDHYSDALDGLLDLIEAGELDGVAIKPILRRLDNLLSPHRYDMCLPGNGPCGAGGRLLSLSADNTISGCDIIHDSALQFGVFPSSTLSRAQASPNADLMRTRPSRLSGCHGCTWLGVCGGTCMARGSINAPDPIDCRVSKRANPALMSRIARSDKLLDWYERFPPTRRRASVIWQDDPTLAARALG